MAKQDTDGHATESEQLISIKVEDHPYSSLTTSLRDMIREFTPLSPDFCIFRASPREREKHPKAFDPVVVSIGPFHHGKENLQSMEKLKLGYLDAFLSRSDHISLETLIKVIKEWENKIRNCYAEKIEFSSDDFVKMILLDSCCVIEILLENSYVYYDQTGERDHLSHTTFRITADLLRDMILLENQLPFFALEGLFNLAFPNSMDTDECFINLCIGYVNVFSFSGDSDLLKKRISQQQPAEVKHLLDLLRKCQAPTIPKQMPDDSSGQKTTMRNATVLENAGLVIKPSLNQSSATDIRYTAGDLEIPKVNVSFLSADVLRNLIALEFCLYFEDSYICDYLHFMDNLIETGKDVDLLIQNGIFELAGETESVATLFNSLKPSMDLTHYYYYGIEEDIEAYRKVNWHTWRASLRRDYCSSPWIIASTVAAIILLLLTLIQTVCSIISV